MNRATSYDIVLAAVLLALSCASLGFIRHQGSSGGMASVYVDGQLTRNIDLSSDSVVDGIAGSHNMSLEIHDGRVSISHTDCPRAICRDTGSISSPGQTLVCVPNKVVVEITGSGRPAYDAESY